MTAFSREYQQRIDDSVMRIGRKLVRDFEEQSVRREKYSRDTNEPEIIQAFERLGCEVWPLCAAEPADLLVLIRGAIHHRLRLVEIKDPSRLPSARKLTRTQKETHELWPVHIVETVDHVLTIVADARGRIPRT